MDPMLVISVHLDDAVLSAGQVVGSWPGATVATVCTAAPEEPMSTEYDRNSGFGTAREAMYRRRAEDANALAVLDAGFWHLGLLDDQYGGSTVDEIERALTAVLEAVQPVVVVAPLGLVHPDHLKVAEACRNLAITYGESWSDAQWWVYEDQPSRVLYPESVQPAFDRWREVGLWLELGFIGTVDLARKEEAVRCYASQLWALDLHAVLCPERLWRING